MTDTTTALNVGISGTKFGILKQISLSIFQNLDDWFPSGVTYYFYFCIVEYTIKRIFLGCLVMCLTPAVVSAQCDTPPPTGAAIQRFCSGQSIVAELVASGTNIKWYDSPVGGTLYAPTDLLKSMDWGYAFYGSQTIDGCESTTRLQVYADLKVNYTQTPGFNFTTTWKSVSSHHYNNIAIKTDGTLWTWGYNNLGQLGDGTTVDRDKPVQIGVRNDWAQAIAGYQFYFAIKTDGTLWAWGSNSTGIFGDGTTISRLYPTQIGTATNWKSIHHYFTHVVALKTDGTLWAWGGNSYGQVGDGTTTTQLTPVQIGTDTDWVSVSVGLQHSLALKADGTLWGWGSNQYRQLGNSTIVPLLRNTVPVQLSSDTDWKTVQTTTFSSFAIKENGTLWGWGNNTWGQLGDPSILNDDGTITQIGTSTWLSIAHAGADRFHSLGIKTDGSLWAWGWNEYGQLGKGVFNDDSYTVPPVQIGTEKNWASVAVGDYISHAIKKDGSIWEWGKTYYEYGVSRDYGAHASPSRLEAPNDIGLQLFCEAATVADLTTSGTDIRWYASPDSRDPLPPNTPLQDEGHYYATQKIDYCESTVRLHAVTLVNSVPIPPPSGPLSQTFCNAATFADLSIEGEDIKWYATSNSEVPLTESTSLSTRQYYARQTIRGCSSFEPLIIDVTVNQTASPEGDTLQAMPIGSMLIDLIVTGENIKWYADGVDAMNQVNQLGNATILEHGLTYYATQTVLDCESETSLGVRITAITGLNSTAETLTFYPNPVENFLVVSQDKHIDRILLVNAYGQQVHESVNNNQQGKLDLSALEKGVYVVRIWSGGRVKQFKVLKR